MRLSAGAGDLPGRTVIARDQNGSARMEDSDGSAIDSHAFANSNSSSDADNDAAMICSTPQSHINVRNAINVGSYGIDFDMRKNSYLQ